MHGNRYSFASALILLVFGSLATLQMIYAVHCGDALEYGFVVPPQPDQNQYQHITSISDIVASQHNHYMHENGRIVIHSIVQLYSGILGKNVFAVCNGLVFILLAILLLRLCRMNIHRPGHVLTVCCLTLIYTFPIKPDIAYQTNYLWTSALITAFLLCFLRVRYAKVGQLTLLALLGFCAGESNEAFTSGIAITIIIIFFHRRMHFSPSQWVLAIAFGIGIIIDIAAPANRIRLGTSFPMPLWSATLSILRYIWMIIPLVLILLWRNHTGSLPIRTFWRRNRIIITAAAINFTVIAMVGIVYAYVCMGLRLLVLILLLSSLHDLRHVAPQCIAPGYTALIALTAAITLYMIHNLKQWNAKYSYIEREYLYHSPDGIVEIPARLYDYEYRGTYARAYPYEWVRRSDDPTAPPLQIWPEGLKSIPTDRDTNALLHIGPQTWVAIQSRQHPAQFVVSRTLTNLPQVSLGSRYLQFGPQSLGYVVDTTAWRAVLYHNTIPRLINVKLEIMK